MKKIILSILAVAAFGTANAQDGGGFKAGINVGLPMGDIKDAYSLAIGLDVAYMWQVSDKFQAGVTTGYGHYMGKTETITILGEEFEFDYEDAGFIPIAGTAQYSFTDNIFGGVDLGYALGISPDGNDGGFLYQPKVGYQTEKFEVYAGYKGISVDGGTFSSVNLGFNYKF
jgi:hypothetical protein